MNDFSIELDNKPFEIEGDLVVSGVLTIGDFNEKFQASLCYWDRTKYLSQWKEALQRLLSGESCTALVTTMYDPDSANFIFWWVMYLIGNKVHVQNHVLFLDELQRPFDEARLYSFIPEHNAQTEDGTPISEWLVEISEIEAFFDRFSK